MSSSAATDSYPPYLFDTTASDAIPYTYFSYGITASDIIPYTYLCSLDIPKKKPSAWVQKQIKRRGWTPLKHGK